ncbi:GrpB family protein [Aquipseudomonas ullengensis]|uniref:GrpB family protein n=1 Tax=Aquipseudomonas ullengensis TaxID=2759166 RepID=A0A7W4LML5_9GAMM|nr:GrpB family protein [Pseudomonas ullengensis]MBB2495817.1 GrpB family protein [Pseudomonas ullengensis]
MIKIVPYRPEWEAEFRVHSQAIRDALGDLALRIDHIGSTSVPGLAAKDVIDIQVTTAELTTSVETLLAEAGYQRRERVTSDHVPPGADGERKEWSKWLFCPSDDRHSANIHVRCAGKANQRYALLFRDFLRADQAMAAAYQRLKETLAHYHPEDLAAYSYIKDPVCDVIMVAAEAWAGGTGWNAGRSDA